jgi:hypothetical protein
VYVKGKSRKFELVGMEVSNVKGMKGGVEGSSMDSEGKVKSKAMSASSLVSVSFAGLSEVRVKSREMGAGYQV